MSCGRIWLKHYPTVRHPIAIIARREAFWTRCAHQGGAHKGNESACDMSYSRIEIALTSAKAFLERRLFFR